MAIVLVALALLVVVLLGIPLAVGWGATHPRRQPLQQTPADWGLPYRDVRFPSREDRLELSGWCIPAAGEARGTAILAHGYAGNRLIGGLALPLAQALRNWGWNVLLFDFRASGASPGRLVSVGVWEVRDLLGAVDWAADRAGGPVVLLGYSMGASVALLAAQAEPAVAGVLADSPYAALAPYLRERLPLWTHLPAWPFNWILLHTLPALTGIELALADPLRGMGALRGRPVLLVAGTADQQIPAAHAQALAAAVPAPEVVLWAVPAADHIAAASAEPKAYLAHVAAWLARVPAGQP